MEAPGLIIEMLTNMLVSSFEVFGFPYIVVLQFISQFRKLTHFSSLIIWDIFQNLTIKEYLKRFSSCISCISNYYSYSDNREID